MAIDFVSFPMKNGGSFQFAMLNYQAGYTILTHADAWWKADKNTGS